MKVCWKEKGKDISQYVTSIEWSGSKSQVARKLVIKVANAPYDPNFKILNIPLGNTLFLLSDSDKEYFRGFVVERERLSKTGEITYTAYDILYYLTKSTATYNFKKKTAEAITKAVCADFKIPVGSLAKTKHKQKLIVKDKKIYDIIMAAYTNAKNVTGDLYQVRASKGKVTVIEYGEEVCDYQLTEDTNIYQAEYKESIDKMINRVKIYNGKGKQSGVVQKAINQKKYGIFQATVTKSKGKNAKTEAKSKLHEKDKTVTVQAVGTKMMDAISGNAVYISDTATGLTGLFWINSDTHKWVKGAHTMSLTLEFKRAMDEKEV